MRAAWDALPPALQATIHPLIAEHSLAYSRDRVQKGILSAKAIAELPPVKQRLFRDNPINGRRALYIGAHAGFIVGWPRATGKALLYELTPARRPAGVPAVACLARGRRDRVGQPRRPAPRHLLRRGQVQALHAAHHHRRRRADGSAMRFTPRSFPSATSTPRVKPNVLTLRSDPQGRVSKGEIRHRASAFETLRWRGCSIAPSRDGGVSGSGTQTTRRRMKATPP